LGGFVVLASRGRDVAPFIVDALKRLRFLGNDCAGLATCADGKLLIRKDRGSVEEVDERLGLSSMPGWVGVGHTRFSTHGRPHADNAHPHTGCFKRIAVVGDGAVSNYEELRDELVFQGHRLVSRSDFEVLAHILEDSLVRSGSIVEAVRSCLRKARGFFSAALLDGERCVAAVFTTWRPVYVGVGSGVFAASNSLSGLYGLVDKVAEVGRGELALVSLRGVEILDVELGKPVRKSFELLNMDPALVDKEGFEHHMLREILDIPTALRRLVAALQKKYLAYASRLVRAAQSIYVIGDGSSLHAGMIASYYLTELAGVSPIVVSAAEFPLYHVENVAPGTLVIAISQSGETGDVVKAVYEAKLRGATILGVTNCVGSRLAELSNLYLPLAAGPEMAVPATKTFINTLATLYLLSLYAGLEGGRVSRFEIEDAISKILELARLLEDAIPRIEEECDGVVEKLARCRAGYVVSRGITYPLALEGALKLKEVAYVVAEGVEAGELLHGPIVLLEENFFTIFVIPVEPGAAKATYAIVSSSFEKKSTTVSIGFADDPDLETVPGEKIRVPRVARHLAPIAFAIPLQLLAYRLGKIRGCPIDSPRYLSKRMS